MHVRTVITTQILDIHGKVDTEVTTSRDAHIGDNPKLFRNAVRNDDLHGRVVAVNLDQVETYVEAKGRGLL
jgi:hypothetical protein